VTKRSNHRRGLLIAGLLLSLTVPVLAVPGIAAITVDPAAVPMFWHVLLGAVVLSVCQWRRIGFWLRDHTHLRSPHAFGYVFAAAYALLSTPLALNLIHGEPVPRFNDIFLVGIVLTCYFFTWEPAACLLVLSVLVSAWVLPPNGTFVVQGFNEWYRLISFTAVSIIIILLIARMKSHRRLESISEPMMGIRSAATGD
jgi:hypothetical protein